MGHELHKACLVRVRSHGRTHDAGLVPVSTRIGARIQKLFSRIRGFFSA